MSNNRFLILYVLIILFFQCCDTPKKTTEEKPTENTLTEKYSYSIEKISKKVSDCSSGECTNVEINYPVFEKPTANQASINRAIEQQIQSILSDFIMEAEGDENLDVLTTMFLESYKKFKKSFPDSETPWTVEIDVVVSATTPQYLSLAFNTSSYTGGAHPNSMIDYVNLSPESKEIKSLDYFFENTEKLREIAEQQFRKKYDLTPTDTLSEKGFIFDNDEFVLTENFGFTESAVIFYYNSYEIAPYAEGPTALLIPLSQLKDVYKF